MFVANFRRSLPMLLAGASLIVSYLAPVRAEVVLNNGTTLTGAITIDGNAGLTKGHNLFHTFSVFNILPAGTSASGMNVPAQESVTFTPPTASGTPVPITNVVTRVTGGTSAYTLEKSSFIDGPLSSSAITGANFWFINPYGVIFGDNAVLDVGGSFHVSTADYIKLSDGTMFAATPAAGELLTSAPPSAFGFLTNNPAPITVGSAVPNLLAVPEGKTFSIVGGTINIGRPDGSAPAFVAAPNGRFNLVSVASMGEATFDAAAINGPVTGDPRTRDINVNNFTQLGDVNIVGGFFANFGLGSFVDGKEIFIRSGNLTIHNSLVLPGILAEFGIPFAPANGGEVKVRADGNVTISGNAPIFGLDSGIHTRAGATGGISEPRDVPDISVEAGGTLTVSGLAQIRSERFAENTTLPDHTNGNVAITADRIEVLGGGQISASNAFDGEGGDLTVNAREIVLDRAGASRFTGLTTQSNFHPAYPGNTDERLTTAAGGTLKVTADTLTMTNGGSISADSFAFGPAGDIMINVGNLSLSRNGNPNGSIATQSSLAGDAGNITIGASGLIELDEGVISATTNASGDGGFIDVTAGSVSISGTDGGMISLTAPPLAADLDAFAQKLSPFFEANFGVSTPDFAALVAAIDDQPGVDLPANAGWFVVLDALNKAPFSVTNVTNLTPGNGGEISVTTPSLVMNAGTRIDSSTLWDGDAGQITGNVGNLTLNDGAQIRSRSGGVVVSTGLPSVGLGQGGNVTLTVDNSILLNGSNSAISTSTFGDGNAGSISLSANQVSVQSGGSVTSESGGTLANQPFAGTGNAGTVTITATGPLTVSGTNSTVSTTTTGAGAGGTIALAGNMVQILNGGSVTADSFGTGFTGDITMTAGNSITLNNGTISTRAVTSDGGNIKLTAPNVIQLTSSEISTSVESGEGGGGNISLDPQFITVNHSKIVANAFGGPGGNISLTAADGIMVSPDSIISASSALSTQGTIEFNSPDTDVASGIAVLPSSFLDVSGLLRSGCDTAGGRASSLAVASRGTLPVHPDSYLPSFGVAGFAGGTQTASATGDIQASQAGGGAGAIALASIGCVM
jgi:filamentous hemagglutinin family protein